MFSVSGSHAVNCAFPLTKINSDVGSNNFNISSTQQIQQQPWMEYAMLPLQLQQLLVEIDTAMNQSYVKFHRDK